MDELACRRFFLNPNQTAHRRYEALRAVFVEGQSQKDAAARFGYTYGSMRQLVNQFRRVSEDQTTATEAFFSRPAAHESGRRVKRRQPIRPWPIVRRSSCLPMKHPS